MGTAFDIHMEDGDEWVGIIPRAVQHLFDGIEERRQKAQESSEPLPEFTINAQFMEVLCLFS